MFMERGLRRLEVRGLGSRDHHPAKPGKVVVARLVKNAVVLVEEPR